MNENNPCLTCGACCAFFRVSFYWAEADDAAGCIPVHLTEPVNAHLRCMSGTNQKNPRCCALEGQPGEKVSCSIYPQRPAACREFDPLDERGLPNDACRRARAHYGLPPLAPIQAPTVMPVGHNQGTIAR